MDGQKRPLNEFATVTVKDGKDLLVTCYEESVSLGNESLESA